PAAAQSKKAPKPKGAAPSAPVAPAAPPNVRVSIDSILDKRTTRDFPGSELEIAFKLEGEDGGAVQSARARLKKAEDDTGRSLIQNPDKSGRDADRWIEKSESGPPSPKVYLASPSRKAKNL